MDVDFWFNAVETGALVVAALGFGVGVWLLANGRLVAKSVADEHNAAIRQTAIEASREAGAEAAKVLIRELTPIITAAISHTLAETLGTQKRLNQIDDSIANILRAVESKK